MITDKFRLQKAVPDAGRENKELSDTRWETISSSETVFELLNQILYLLNNSDSGGDIIFENHYFRIITPEGNVLNG